MGLPSPLIAMNALWRSFLGRNYSPATDNTAYDTESLPPLPITSGGTGADSAMAAMNKLVPNVAASTDIINSLAGFVGTGNEAKKIPPGLLKSWLEIVNGYSKGEIDTKLQELADSLSASSGGVYNTKIELSKSGTYNPPITGYYKVTCIGPGGNSGKEGNSYTSNGYGTASGGLGGPGGAGEFIYDYVKLFAGQGVAYTINSGASSFLQIVAAKGINGGDGGNARSGGKENSPIPGASGTSAPGSSGGVGAIGYFKNKYGYGASVNVTGVVQQGGPGAIIIEYYDPTIV